MHRKPVDKDHVVEKRPEGAVSFNPQTRRYPTMANEQNTRGGSHEQHVKAGEQSHKNTHGGSHEQQSKAGEQSHKGGESGTRGGSHEQHVKAGQQSHKGS